MQSVLDRVPPPPLCCPRSPATLRSPCSPHSSVKTGKWLLSSIYTWLITFYLKLILTKICTLQTCIFFSTLFFLILDHRPPPFKCQKHIYFFSPHSGTVQRTPRHYSTIGPTQASDPVFVGFSRWCWVSWRSWLEVCQIWYPQKPWGRRGWPTGMVMLGQMEELSLNITQKVSIPDLWLNICCYKWVVVRVIDLPLHFSSQRIWHCMPPS